MCGFPRSCCSYYTDALFLLLSPDRMPARKPLSVIHNFKPRCYAQEGRYSEVSFAIGADAPVFPHQLWTTLITSTTRSSRG